MQSEKMTSEQQPIVKEEVEKGEEEELGNEDNATANYYRGVLYGLSGTKEEKRTEQFLQSRDLYFPFDMQNIPGFLLASTDFQRGVYESSGEFLFDKEGRPIVHCTKLDQLKFTDVDALDFLGLLYDTIDLDEQLYDYTMYYAFKKLCQQKTRDEIETNIHFKRINPSAMVPFKEKTSDAGYEINVIRKIVKNDTVSREFTYDTGLIITPPFGYYFEVFPTPLLLERGYTVSNTPYILERSTTTCLSQTLKITIRLIDDVHEALPLDCPFPAIRLVPRHVEHFSLVEDKLQRIK
jgi:hypothetical protein